MLQSGTVRKSLFWSDPCPALTEVCHEFKDTRNQMKWPAQFIFWFCWLLWPVMKWDETYLAEDERPCYREQAQCITGRWRCLLGVPHWRRIPELHPCCFPSAPCQCGHTTSCKISLCHRSHSVLPLESRHLVKTRNTSWSPQAQRSFTRYGPCSSVKGTEASTSIMEKNILMC